MKTKIILTMLVLIFSLAFVQAVVINNVAQQDLFPGEDGVINVEIKNTLDDDIEDVSLSLDLSMMPFIAIGGSEDNEDEINDGDKEMFSFRLKASQDIVPGDYNIPYMLIYTFDMGNVPEGENATIPIMKVGVIGITVSAETELEFNVETENPAVVGKRGKVIFEIVNSGFGNIKAVKIDVMGNGMTLLEDGSEYIGTVSADDTETASFEVLFNSQAASLIVDITYKDFANKNITERVTLPINVYTKERALELGIITKSYTYIYVIVVAVLVVLWLIYRKIRKKRKKRKKEA